jgi:Domain of unknown function (DUF4185)
LSFALQIPAWTASIKQPNELLNEFWAFSFDRKILYLEGEWMRLEKYSQRRHFKTGTQASIFSVLAFCLLFSSFDLIQSAPTESPYPPSPIIQEMTVDWDTLDRRASGSDNWPITWAADDHQYTSWGDGGGFNGSNQEGRVSLGVARIEGNWDDYRGYNVWGGINSEHPATFGGKSYGILGLHGWLYKWISPGSDYHNYREARLAVSTDNGATWKTEDWAFTQDDKIVLPTFLQFGKDYSGARDSYIYVYAIRLQDAGQLQVQKPGQIDLIRVPAGSLRDKEAYEYFSGKDRQGNPIWGEDGAARQPVFENPQGVGWNLSVSYNSGLGRYLLATEHSRSFEGNWGLFDAGEPWGPWTTVGYYNQWENAGSNFFWNFSNKWTSEDGDEFTLIYTGIGENDAWHSVRGRFIVNRIYETGISYNEQMGNQRRLLAGSSRSFIIPENYDPRIN